MLAVWWAWSSDASRASYAQLRVSSRVRKDTQSLSRSAQAIESSLKSDTVLSGKLARQLSHFSAFCTSRRPIDAPGGFRLVRRCE